ncbi:mucin-13 isoform X3 [Paroedura picta]|uniref:mucin-13 isoform X3 n=1 Tax=Paroedura picta TaxID=143630 RepID=UPI004055B042
MKACVLLTVLWFAFCALQGVTTTTTQTSPTTISTSTSSETPTTTSSTSTRSETPTTTIRTSTRSETPTTTSSTSTRSETPTTTSSTSTRSETPTTTISTSTRSETPTTTSSTSTRSETPTTTSSTSTRSETPTTTISTSTRSETPTTTSSTSTRSETPTTTISTSTRSEIPTTTSSTSTRTGVTTTRIETPPTTSNTSTGSETPTTTISTSTRSGVTTTIIETPPTTSNTSTGSETPPTTSSTSTRSGVTTTRIETPPTTSTTSTSSVILPCDKNPCIYGATCIDLENQDFVCECPIGLYYTNTSGCQKGKVFPGDLSLSNVPYESSMADKSTKEYKKLYDNVTQMFRTVFENETAYKQTIILSVKSSLQKSDGYAVVLLTNIFDTSTNLSSLEVQSLIEKALPNSSFKTVPQCDLSICDSQTTDCKESKDNTRATCECKQGLAKKNPEDTYCLLCADCASENNMQCITKEPRPECECMINFHAKDGTCQACNFGFSGKNCEDHYLVVIVVVSVVCGIVIVVLAGVLIYKSLSAKKNLHPERTSLLRNDYSSTGTDSENKSTTNGASTEKIFPKVLVKSSADQGDLTRNSDERGLANTAYLPEQDYDDAGPSTFEMTTRRKL